MLEKLDRVLELLAERERTFDELKAETSQPHKNH